jgi:hypothetical protein
LLRPEHFACGQFGVLECRRSFGIGLAPTDAGPWHLDSIAALLDRHQTITIYFILKHFAV